MRLDYILSGGRWNVALHGFRAEVTAKPDAVDPQWPRFYFNGNQAWGWIESPDDWEWLKMMHRRGWMSDRVTDGILRARSLPSGPPNEFGLYGEYSGPHTLRQFLGENGIVP